MRGVSTITPVNVNNATMTQLIAQNRDRVTLEILNETAGIIYLGFGDQPSDITTMGKVLSNSRFLADSRDQCEQAVWCYHEQGAAINSTTATTPGDDAVKVRESI
jgi:hypothetical protein